MELIDKAAVVAKLRRRIQESIDAGGATRGVYLSERMKEDSYILSFIDTLEVKEVDLDKELNNLLDDVEGVPRMWHSDEQIEWGKAIVKHFFGLGLKAQQNISINVTDIDKVFEENGVDPNSKEAKMFKESYYMALEKHKAQKGK